jgi:hypothetical protein
MGIHGYARRPEQGCWRREDSREMRDWWKLVVDFNVNIEMTWIR